MNEFTISGNMVGKIPALLGDTQSVGVADKCPSDSFGVIWGYKPEDGFSVTSEFGFFRNAVWLDRKGIYWDSSLTSIEGKDWIMSYRPPEDLVARVVNSSINTKYAQPIGQPLKWDGVILIGQNPLDCNIAYTGRTPDTFDHNAGYGIYMGWYREMCDKYRDNLLVKIHPFIATIPAYRDIFVEIASEYGSRVGQFGLDVLEGCEKVLAYSSTMILDCWMRDIKVEQHGEGFFQNFTSEEGKHLANFLMWKFCVPLDQSEQEWYEVWRCFRDSPLLYPIPEDKSWGAWFVRNN